MSLHRNNVVTLSRRNNDVIIDLIHKSHNAHVPHPTMHHFVTEMCPCVHFSVAKWCIVGHLFNALWDLWDGSIALCVRWDRTTLPLKPRLHYIKHTVHWLHGSGCWFHLESADLHIICFHHPIAWDTDSNLMDMNWWMGGSMDGWSVKTNRSWYIFCFVLLHRIVQLKCYSNKLAWSNIGCANSYGHSYSDRQIKAILGKTICQAHG